VKLKQASLALLALALLAVGLMISNNISFSGINMKSWHDCALDYDSQRMIEFSVGSETYAFRAIQTSGVQDLSRMWSGFPEDRNKYAVVALEGGRLEEPIPLLGRMSSFLELNRVTPIDSGKLRLEGGDGGGSWTATVHFELNEGGARLDFVSARDDRCLWLFRM
jgi:hypothetical protein